MNQSLWGSSVEDMSEHASYLLKKLKSETGFTFVPSWQNVYNRLAEKYMDMDYSELKRINREGYDLILDEDLLFDSWLKALVSFCTMFMNLYDEWKEFEVVYCFFMWASEVRRQVEGVDWFEEDHGVKTRQALEQLFEIGYWESKELEWK